MQWHSYQKTIFYSCFFIFFLSQSSKSLSIPPLSHIPLLRSRWFHSMFSLSVRFATVTSPLGINFWVKEAGKTSWETVQCPEERNIAKIPHLCAVSFSLWSSPSSPWPCSAGKAQVNKVTVRLLPVTGEYKISEGVSNKKLEEHHNNSLINEDSHLSALCMTENAEFFMISQDAGRKLSLICIFRTPPSFCRFCVLDSSPSSASNHKSWDKSMDGISKTYSYGVALKGLFSSSFKSRGV